MDYANRTYHEVLRGSRFELPAGKPYPAGYALRFEEAGYYVLKLWFQQDRTYYIQRNTEKSAYYTIFSKKEIQPDSTVCFKNPIGYARMVDHSEYLEVILPDLPRRYYVSLFAKS